MSTKEKIKIIFAGTPDFGLPSLKALIKSEDCEVVLVITQEDKKIGRKQILTSPPIKIEAQKHNIPVLQPKKIIEAKKQISELNPDLMVVIAYGQIIPKEILNIPTYGSINIHGSLLPKYRGSSCVQAPILNGDKETGVTIMKMDSGLDTGPILKQNKIKLAPGETTESLYKKLSKLGADFLLPTLKEYIAGNIKPKAQNNSKASYISKLTKKDGRIDWNKTAEELERFIRAMYSWPGAFTEINGKLLKIIEAGEILNINNYKPGNFFLIKNKLAVQCGQNALAIKKIQPSGKKIMTAKEFIQGNKKLIIDN